MTGRTLIPEVDRLPVEGGRSCPGCGRVKPPAAFDADRCRACVSAAVAARVGRKSDAGARYAATAKGKAAAARYRGTTLGKISHNIVVLRYKLRILDAGPPYPKWFRGRSRAVLQARLDEYIKAREEIRAKGGR